MSVNHPRLDKQHTACRTVALKQLLKIENLFDLPKGLASSIPSAMSVIRPDLMDVA